MPRRSEVVIFNGIKFRRYPDSPNWADRVYFTPGPADRARGVQRLHQEIWKAEHGPIPEDHDVHHKDHDPLNNDPSNLVCIAASEHDAHHAADRDYRTPERLALLESIRPLAAVWHGSEEGLAWHREHAKRTFGNRPMVTLTCGYCGKDYETNTPATSRFCTAYCKHRARLESGVDDETRACEFCGTEFRVNKYLRKRFCTRSCATKFWRRRAA